MGSRLDPLDEEHRLEALRRYHILDTPPEPAFDDLARLAIQVCNAPIAVISFVDEHRQWFKARIGLSVVEPPRDGSFSTYAIARRDLFMVPDTAADPRFAANPLVAGESQIRFYAGAPVFTPEGHALGTISVMDRVPRELDRSQQEAMQALARQVMAQLELRRDVTERKRAERAVRDERDRAQRYLDAAEVILLALDTNGLITLINRKGCDVLGWSESELTGRAWVSTCLPERMREKLTQKFHSLVEGDLSIVENPILTKGGEERLVEWRNRVLRDENGCAIGTLSSGTDITDRARAVDALRTAEERMRFALQYADIGIWDMDCTTGLLQWSEVLEAHYGIAPGAFEGTFEAFVKRIDPRDRDAGIATIEQGMKSGADFTMEHRTVWPDGTQRWLTGAGRFILDPQGKPVRGLGISLDVTDRRKLEDQYHQAQKVEAIGRLTGGVAHDFNNVLSVVLAHACFLLEDLSEVDPRRADAMEIKMAAERAAGLTKQLLAFSRKQVLAPRALDLNASIAVMEKMLRRLIGEDIVLVIEPSPNLGIVKADGGQIEQVLMNLAVNARDAMPKGGTLTLRTANVQIDELGEYVMFSVSDSGVGMSAEVQQHMFDPFFTTKEIGKGTGLGLSTCYGIVKQSGGHICASSELGLGTTFKVYLPRIDEVVQAQPARSGVPDLRGTETVLLVDDDEKVRAAALSILERKGYRVLEANGADQALAKAKNHTGVIDLVLSDVVMPRGSGPDLAERLRVARPDIAVLLMSGFTEHAVVERAFAEGANHVQKPFTPETLAGRVREVLDRRNPP